MTQSGFSHRPFNIPEQIVSRALKLIAQDKSLTPLMHEYTGRMGDYDLAKTWLQTLTKKFNWSGATLMFNAVLDYHARANDGDARYRQTMFEQNGVPVGYSRVLNLSRDTPTRRIDCAKIEETLVPGQPHIADPSLFVYMHDVIAADSKAQGKKRLMTELGVGFHPKKFNSVARHIAMLSRDPLQSQEVARLRRMFDRDWVSVTVNFAHKIGFRITDIIVPQSFDGEVNPQLRVSRDLGNGTPAPLPPFIVEGRESFRYKNEGSLKPVRDFMARIRVAAAQKYDLDI